jgi:hypothetical protein
MQENSIDKNSNFFIGLIKEHFGDNATAFNITPFENEQNFFLDFLVYRSFKARFSLGFSARFKEGIIYHFVYVGGDPIMLSSLIGRGKDQVLAMNFNKESIQDNLEALDEYLQWRMTDAQKKTFGLI